MDHGEIARRQAYAAELHKKNFNCAQCVACASCDLVGLDETVAFKMMDGFGGGMGCHRETCGALSGAVAIVSYAMSDGPHNPTTKRETYKQTKKIVTEFREKNGATLCGDLKGLTGGPKLQECSVCIDDALRYTLEFIDDWAAGAIGDEEPAPAAPAVPAEDVRP